MPPLGSPHVTPRTLAQRAEENVMGNLEATSMQEVDVLYVHHHGCRCPVDEQGQYNEEYVNEGFISVSHTIQTWGCLKNH